MCGRAGGTWDWASAGRVLPGSATRVQEGMRLHQGAGGFEFCLECTDTSQLMLSLAPTRCECRGVAGALSSSSSS